MYVHSLTKLLCLTLYLHLVNDCVKDFNSAIVDTWMSSKQIMQAIRQKSYDDAVSVPIKGSAKIRRISCMTCILAAEILFIFVIQHIHSAVCRYMHAAFAYNTFQIDRSIDGQLLCRLVLYIRQVLTQFIA